MRHLANWWIFFGFIAAAFVAMFLFSRMKDKIDNRFLEPVLYPEYKWTKWDLLGGALSLTGPWSRHSRVSA